MIVCLLARGFGENGRCGDNLPGADARTLVREGSPASEWAVDADLEDVRHDC